MQWLNRLQRRCFGRCAYCAGPFRSCDPHVWGYEWNGWLASEGGLYHSVCLEQVLTAERRRAQPRIAKQIGYDEPMQLRGV